MTEAALVLAPLACSLVLLVSGVAKLRDPDGTRAAMISLHVPARFTTTAAAQALCGAELALGLALLLTWGWALAVVGAATTALFASYWVVVALVLRRGEDVECHCFGSLGSDRVTRWTLGRNTALVVLGALAVALGSDGSGLPTGAGDLGRAGWAWLAMTLLVTATAVLIVAPGSAPEKAAQEKAGRQDVPDVDHSGDEELLDYERSPIPFAILEDDQGERVTLRHLAQQRPQLLAFISIGCGACTVALEKLSGAAAELGPVQVQAIYTNYLSDVPSHYRLPGITHWHDVEGGATAAFCHSGRPVAVLLGADGQLAGGPVTGREAIDRFVEDIVAELQESLEPAPEQADAHA